MSARILFTIPNFITAGSGRAMLNIVERLDRRHFQPAICVLKKGGRLDEEVEALGITFLEAPFTVPAKPYSRLLPHAWRSAQPFREYQFDLWHSFHYSSDYTEPIIARLSGAKAWVYTKKNMGWGSLAWKARTVLAKRVAVQNQDMMQSFFATLPYRSRRRFIPRGVDTQKFQPATPLRMQLRQQRKLEKAIIVGCVAHLVPVKGHPTLLHAVARVPDVHLLLSGKPLDEDYVASLKLLAEELEVTDRVTFLGGVSDVPALLAELDIFVLPTISRGEGCPVALLEAMASGRACVATKVPGSRDLIEHERSGLLVPPENPEALAEAISRLSRSPGERAAFGHAARRRVEQHYTIEREVADHEALYAEILRL